jgi:hypothetical protein
MGKLKIQLHNLPKAEAQLFKGFPNMLLLYCQRGRDAQRIAVQAAFASAWRMYPIWFGPIRKGCWLVSGTATGDLPL